MQVVLIYISDQQQQVTETKTVKQYATWLNLS